MIATIYEVRTVNVSPEGRERIERCNRERLCLGCLRPLDALSGTPVRGMHRSCRRRQSDWIAAGAFTEEDCIRDGKLLPEAARGRPVSNPVTIEARRRLAARDAAAEAGS